MARLTVARAPKPTPGAAPASLSPAETATASAAPETATDAGASSADAPNLEGLGKRAAALPATASIETLLELVKVSPADMIAEIGLNVVGPQPGRRRAGRQFGPEAQVLPIVDLTEDELRAIDGDPALTWSVVRIEGPEADEA